MRPSFVQSEPESLHGRPDWSQWCYAVCWLGSRISITNRAASVKQKWSHPFLLILTCWGGNGADQYWRDHHNEAAKSGHKGKNSCSSSCFRGEHALEIDLPGNAAERQHQEAVQVGELVSFGDRANPHARRVRDGLHIGVRHRKGNSNPLQREECITHTGNLWKTKSKSIIQFVAEIGFIILFNRYLMMFYNMNNIE